MIAQPCLQSARVKNPSCYQSPLKVSTSTWDLSSKRDMIKLLPSLRSKSSWKSASISYWKCCHLCWWLSKRRLCRTLWLLSRMILANMCTGRLKEHSKYWEESNSLRSLIDPWKNKSRSKTNILQTKKFVQLRVLCLFKTQQGTIVNTQKRCLKSRRSRLVKCLGIPT